MERGGSSGKKGIARSGKEKTGSKCPGGKSGSECKGDEYMMPKGTVTRIMQHVLPEEAKVSEEAKEAVQQCVSQFISFITREANHRCKADCRSTITPNDIISTMAALGFHDYVGPLTLFLNKRRGQESSQSRPWPQMDLFPPPAPQPAPTPVTVPGYVPSPAVVSEDYFDLPHMRDYFLDNHASGEGSEFDPFN